MVLHGAMHYVTFSNADDLPPPIRLENQSLVPVLYKQAGVYSPRLQQMLKPNSYGKPIGFSLIVLFWFFFLN